MAVERLKGELSESNEAFGLIERSQSDTSDVAEVHIDGRYPEQGFILDEQSDTMVRVMSGAGVVAVRGAGYELHTGSVVRIDKHTPHYYEGDRLRLLIVSSPARHPNGQKHLE